MTAPPVIGVSTYRERSRFGVWDVPADVLAASYADSVCRAGGMPVLLPPATADPDAAAAAVSRLDALIVAGGADVDPSTYGREPGRHTTTLRHDRDRWELALFDAAQPTGIPVLGICRGMQVMAVHAGGTLEQHLPDVVSHNGHSPGGDVYGTIAVDVAPGSLLHGLIGAQVTVQCHHHQSVDSHPGLDSVACAADGTIEAIERPGDRFWLGVQWHPEVSDDIGLFTGIVDAARQFAAARPDTWLVE